MELIRKYHLSAAIFAQAWTYEVLGGALNFFQNENDFWERLRPYLLVHGPTTFPLKTSFCQGFGKKTFEKGSVRVSCLIILNYLKEYFLF